MQIKPTALNRTVAGRNLLAVRGQLSHLECILGNLFSYNDVLPSPSFYMMTFGSPTIELEAVNLIIVTIEGDLDNNSPHVRSAKRNTLTPHHLFIFIQLLLSVSVNYNCELGTHRNRELGVGRSDR